MVFTFKIILMAAASYIIGSISPSIIIGKIKGIDIKKEGSGNAGATNAYRVLGKGAALVTLIFDVGKGFFSAWMGAEIGGPVVGYVSAIAVCIGHVFPCFYNFKGGKGVATALGAVLAVNWCVAVLALGVFAVVLAGLNIVSLGSIVAAASLPIIAAIFEPGFKYYAIVIALLIVIKHKDNIKRIIKKEEPKAFRNKEENNDKNI